MLDWKVKTNEKVGIILKKNLIKKSTLLVLLVFLFIAFTASCSYGKTVAKKTTKPAKKVVVNHPKVEMILKNGKTMVFELYPEYAPETVNNFLKLSKAGFYNGLKFHRIIKGFMVQGGDPKGDGTGGADKNIKGEFAHNGFTKNTLKHTKGVISMARSQDPNSASSQFFIMDGAAPNLNGDYAAFGKLIEGEKTLDFIASTPVEMDPSSGEMSKPIKDVFIKKVIVLNDTKK